MTFVEGNFKAMTQNGNTQREGHNICQADFGLPKVTNAYSRVAVWRRKIRIATEPIRQHRLGICRFRQGS